MMYMCMQGFFYWWVGRRCGTVHGELRWHRCGCDGRGGGRVIDGARDGTGFLQDLEI